MSTPAGWYEQPDGQQRYWDGSRWTGDVAPGAETTTPGSQTAGNPAAAGGPAGPTVKKKHLIGYVATGLVALAVGAGLGAGVDSVKNAGADSRTPTETVTVATPGPTTTTTVPGPTITRTDTSTVTNTVTTTVTKPAPTVTVTTTQAVVPQVAAGAIPGDGTFQVGADIQPGTYVSAPPAVNCYWARLSSSNTSDIIDSNNSSGQSVVTIEPSDKYFESSGCSEWTRR